MKADTKTNLPKAISEAIDLINKYFVERIMKGDYSVVKINDCTAEIKMNTGEEFSLWIANAYFNFECYSGGKNKADLDFTQAQKQELHRRFRKIYEDKQKSPAEIERRKKEYLKLKAEFEQA